MLEIPPERSPFTCCVCWIDLQEKGFQVEYIHTYDLYSRVTGNQNEKSGPHNDLNTLPRVAHPEIPHILKGRRVAVDNLTNLLKLVFVDQFFQLLLKF